MGNKNDQNNKENLSLSDNLAFRAALLETKQQTDLGMEQLCNKIQAPELSNAAKSISGNQMDKLLSSLTKYENMDIDNLDTYGCDRIFAHSFVQTNKEMTEDFPYIFKDFLIHEYENLNKYNDEHYVDVEDWKSSSPSLLSNLGMNMMINAVMGGSQYTKALFIYLFKTYYRDEYKILKRFNKLSQEDIYVITGFDKLRDNFEEQPDYDAFDIVINRIARTVFIARLIGIELAPDCINIYATLDMILDSSNLNYSYRHWVRESASTLYPDCIMESDICYPDKKMSKLDSFLEQVTKASIRWLGFEPSQFTGHADDNIYPCTAHIDRATALLVLKLAFPDKVKANETFTEEQVAMAYQILKQTRATISLGVLQPNMILSSVFPKYADAGIDTVNKHPILFDGSKITYTDVKPEPKVSSAVEDNPENSDVNETPKKQLQELRLKLHALENENKSLREGYEDLKLLKEENAGLLKKMNDLTTEATALRSYIYELTEDDIKRPLVDLISMKEELRNKKVIIIGGHPNWVQKLRTEFSKWEFISAAVSGALDPRIVDGADKVYFFSDTLAHATYYRYLNVLRDKGVQFGYIHGVNIEKNIRHFYMDICTSQC